MANLSRLGIQLQFLQVRLSRLAPESLARPLQVTLGEERTQMLLRPRSYADQQRLIAEEFLAIAQGGGGESTPAASGLYVVSTTPGGASQTEDPDYLA